MTATGFSTLVEQARGIAELAGRRAGKAEAARTPDADVIAALVAAGAARHFVPASLGGSGGTFAELKQAAVVIGAECPATAWCAVVAGLMTRAANHLPPAGQRQLWAGGPDVLIAGGVTPRGTATAVAGGWLLSGAWPAVSSSERADWILLVAAVRGEGGPGQRVCLVPRASVLVERTWDDVGMQATGSHTVVAEQVFVPDPMTFPAGLLTETDAPRPGPDGRPVPLPAVNTFLFCLPMLGAAHGALRYWRRLTGAKLRGRADVYDPVVAHLADVFARSSGEIDAAELLLDRVARVVDTAPAVTRSDVARHQRDCALAAELLVRAVDRLMRASGTAGHSTGSVLQRLWRDLHTASSHATLQFGTAAAGYARAELIGAG
ncbi:hydrolase [Streptomyces rubradiris]|uniref:Hydrolase n=1 Tax=Streptomyces rubradiris TaxID=285531 RepID=A0ABQ3RR60_STRRR|nr:hydrolase [Streptomyces rubradiris]GHH31217.1 hydrolase [Streptomyces rubradiris]GHI52877.1 hydrolase [Streptomyces rubradiris]GHI58326.1 hydrolase [Streptomyces rubradiris]GHI58348.1 hydrolase [Streptomyces rubradiris]